MDYYGRKGVSMGLFIGLTTLAAAAQAEVTINQSTIVGSSGAGVAANGFAVGETFTAPTENVLQDFTLYQTNFAPDANSNARVEFLFHIASWNGSVPGADLATSSPFLSPSAQTFNQPYTYTLPGGGLNLIAGQQYISYLTSVSDSRYSGTTNTSLSYISGNGTDYSGGTFIFKTATSQWFSVSSQDAAFKADFTSGLPAAPEPSQMATLSLVVLSLCGLLFRARRKTAAGLESRA